MPLYRWSELKTWLDSHNLRPRRGLSQNFLIDGHIVEKILAQVPTEDHPIIEIGPGPGVLTESFFSRGQRLRLIEADQTLAYLLDRFEPLETHVGDVLKIDPIEWLAKRVPQESKTSVVSNLPYHLSTPFFKSWLMTGQWVKRLVIMVQKEFAERLWAEPASDAYCPLSVYASHYVDSIESFDVAKTCFYPAPKVTSCVLTLTLKNVQPCPQVKPVLEHLFNQRRKILFGVAKRKGWRALEGDLEVFAQCRIEKLPAKALWDIAVFFSEHAK